MTRQRPRRIGLAIVGGGRIGTFRGQIAGQHPQVDWIGVAELRPDRASKCGADIGADFVTTDYKELLARQEVTAVIIATNESQHVKPTLEAAERGHSLLIEKPLATKCSEVDELASLAATRGLVLMVGHTFIYNAAVRYVKSLIDNGPRHYR